MCPAQGGNVRQAGGQGLSREEWALLSTFGDKKETARERGSDRSKVMGLEESEPRIV